MDEKHRLFVVRACRFSLHLRTLVFLIFIESRVKMTNIDAQAAAAAFAPQLPSGEFTHTTTPATNPPDRPSAEDILEAAQRWLGFGLNATLLRPGTAQAAVPVKREVEDQSCESIASDLAKHPDSDLGFAVGPYLLVLRAKSNRARSALTATAQKFRFQAKAINESADGMECFFWLEKRTATALAATSNKGHPNQIEVLTGDALVPLPPSRGRVIAVRASNIGDFDCVGQGFVDAIGDYNARLDFDEVDDTPVAADLGVIAEDAAVPETPAVGDRLVTSIAPKPATEFCVPPRANVLVPMAASVANTTQSNHPLLKYSLRDRLAYLEQQMVAQVLILGQLVLLGQSTVIYALSGTGKTLLVIYMLLEAIKKGLIDPLKLIYINMDDNSSGLVDKVGVAQEFDFHMLADGHQGFEAKKFRDAMEKMIADDTARGVIVVLDTLKKFVDTMHKRKSTEFAKVIRQFVSKGGTVIALAHANKKLGPDGKPIYSGTTDIVEDFDCALTLATVSKHTETNQKVVEFVNFKGRGKGDESAAYSYSIDRNLSYYELLSSVQVVDDEQLVPLKQAEALRSDAELIEVVLACIDDGVTTKMRLRDAVAQRAGLSNRLALQIIEKYTGPDPALHRWTYTVGDRGAKLFARLELPAESGKGSTPATT
ncbi:MAG: AAA family ATPase [Rhodoferax sp.]